jgi:hypothetical protein
VESGGGGVEPVVVDEQHCLWWARQFAQSLRNAGIDRQKEVLLVLDRHQAQTTQRFKNYMDSENDFLLYTPASCTDLVQPVDHHCGVMLKFWMAEFYEIEDDLGGDWWLENGMPPMFQRINIVRWVTAAWKMMCRYPGFFTKLFQNTGHLNAKDGSENHLIRLDKYEKVYNIDDDSNLLQFF